MTSSRHMILYVFCTFVFFFVLEVSGKGHQVPTGPGTYQRDWGTVCALLTFVPLAYICQFHDVTTEVPHWWDVSSRDAQADWTAHNLCVMNNRKRLSVVFEWQCLVGINKYKFSVLEKNHRFLLESKSRANYTFQSISPEIIHLPILIVLGRCTHQLATSLAFLLLFIVMQILK